MSNMQIVFSVIGLILIVAIIGHGMWTIRKNERQQREQAAAVERKRSDLDREGFDQDGIGSVRVVRKAESNAPVASPAPAEPVEATSEPVIEKQETSAEIPVAEVPATEPQSEAETAPETAPEPIRASREEPEPVAMPTVTAEPEQAAMELTVAAEPDEQVPTQEPDEVIVLHVMGQIEGPVLLQQMTELGFKFGEFSIFHRHVDTAGNGPVLFSLANMFNPGTFDIDQIETFETQGVALFLALPIKGDSKQAFTMMHNAAVKLAKAIGKGQVLDEHRNPLTRQAVQHIHQRIREYERQRLIRQ
ncbi:cell division protein ZipA [Pseudidiomarina taiwanensis]|nr:cell division protein ZipA [Pseudidiomarina taiwanensis]